MKINSILLIVIFITTTTIFGCKTNSTGPGNNAPVVTIIPSSFHGTEFVVDTFKAKIYNHDFGETIFKWDMGDSTMISNYPPYSFQAIHQYTKPGSYTITVKAYDIYTNEVIATSTLVATIDTAKSSVEIIPQFYNGTLTTNTLGTFDPFMLSVKTTLPLSQVKQYWDYGDGTTDSLGTGFLSTKHSFPHPGSYLVSVNLYQSSGVYIDADTALITISLPNVTLDMLKQMTRFEEFFYVDSSYTQFAKVQQLYAMSLHFWQDSLHVSSWNGNDFSIKYHSSSSGIQNDSIGGTISQDQKSVSVLKVHGRRFYSLSSFGEYGFTASDLKLIGVTADSRIIYRLTGIDAKNNLQNTFLNIIGSFNIGLLTPIGTIDNWQSLSTLAKPPQPVIILIFD